MTGAQLVAIWRVESKKLLSRGLGRFGLVVAVAIGLLGPLWLRFAAGVEGDFNGTPVQEMFEISGAHALLWALTFRNLMVMRLFLVGLVAASIAGEFHARTLRDDLVHPVSRWSVLVAKWGALATWLLVGIGMSWMVAAVLGCLLFGTEGPWFDAVMAWSVTLLCDIGFATIAIAVAVWLRSTVGTLIGMVLFMMADRALGLFLWAVEGLSQAAEVPWAMEVAIQARPWLPSSAFGVWAAWNGGDPWVWQNFASLAAITAIGLIVAIARFQRLDVP